MKYVILFLPIFVLAKGYFVVDKLPKDEVLPMYKKASLKAGVISTIPFATRCVEVLKCKTLDDNSTWCKVKYFKKSGWIDSSKVSKDDGCIIDKNSTIIQKIVKTAKQKLGSPYRYGKSGPNSFDCSGFVYYVFKKIGIGIPRTSIEQSKTEHKLKRNELKVGDIVVFDTYHRGHVNHSGIYLGNGNFIHATSGKAFRVTISNLDKGFYLDKFRWGVRVIQDKTKFH